MKNIKMLMLFLLFAFIICGTVQVKAQCAMCTASVESNSKNGNKATNGLNAGIMYLLAAPYLVVAVGGYIWYTKFRRKEVNLEIRSEKLNLN